MKVTTQNTKEGNFALQKIHSAINKAADYVSPTLGPAGTDVLVGSKFTIPEISNDGKRILNSLEFEDEVENEVLKLMKAEVNKTNDLLGDSSTTTTTLMQAVFNAGYSQINSNDFIKVASSPREVRKKIMEAKDAVIAKLKPTPVKKLADLKNVAFISTEDKELGDKIAEAVYKVGKNGLVKVEPVPFIGIETEYIEGMEVSSGFISRFMANQENGEAVMDDVHVLVVDTKIENGNTIAQLSQQLITQGTRKLVIFVPDIDPAVTMQLLSARVPDKPENRFHFVVVKANVWDKGIFEDIASVTGAILIDSEAKITPACLGKVSKITVDLRKTLILGGKKDINTTELEAELKKTTSPFDKQKLEERIARLTGKVAVIRAGAQTEGKTSHLKDKLDDGINACKRALEGGVVPGGGSTLFKIANELPENILTEAIKVPYNKIQESTGGIEITSDVIDPAVSTIKTLEVACEFACNMLKLGAVIADKNESDTE